MAELTPQKRPALSPGSASVKSHRIDVSLTDTISDMEDTPQSNSAMVLSMQDFGKLQIEEIARADVRKQRLAESTSMVLQVFDRKGLSEHMLSSLATSQKLLSKMPAKDLCKNDDLWQKVVEVQKDCEKYERLVTDFADDIHGIKNDLCTTSIFVADLVRESKGQLDEARSGCGKWDLKRVEGTLRMILDKLKEVDKKQHDQQTKYRELMQNERGDAIIVLRNELSGVRGHTDQLVHNMQRSHAAENAAAVCLAQAQSKLEFVIQTRELAEIEEKHTKAALAQGQESLEALKGKLVAVGDGEAENLCKTVLDMESIVRQETRAFEEATQARKEELRNKQAHVDRIHLSHYLSQVETQQAPAAQHHFHVVFEGSKTMTKEKTQELMEKLQAIQVRSGAEQRKPDWVSLTWLKAGGCVTTLQKDWDSVLNTLARMQVAGDHSFPLEEALAKVEEGLQSITDANPTSPVFSTVLLCSVRGQQRHFLMNFFKGGGWKKLTLDVSAIAGKICSTGSQGLHRCAALILVADKVDVDTSADLSELVASFNHGERQLAMNGVTYPLLFSNDTSPADLVENTVLALEKRWVESSASSLWHHGMHDTHLRERERAMELTESQNRKQLQLGIEEMTAKLKAAECAQEHGSQMNRNRRAALTEVLQTGLNHARHEEIQRMKLLNDITHRKISAKADEARQRQTIATLEESLKVAARAAYKPDQILEDYQSEENELRSRYGSFDQAGVHELLVDMASHVRKNKLQLNNAAQVFDMVTTPVYAKFRDMQNVFSHLDDRVMPQRVIKEFIDGGLSLNNSTMTSVDHRDAWAAIVQRICSGADLDQLKQFMLALDLSNFCFSIMADTAAEMRKEAEERDQRNRDLLMTHLIQKGQREHRDVWREIQRLKLELEKTIKRRKAVQGKIRVLENKRDGDPEEQIAGVPLSSREEEKLEKLYADLDRLDHTISDWEAAIAEMTADLQGAIMEDYKELFNDVLPTVSQTLRNVCTGIILSAGAEQFYSQLESIMHLFSGQVVPFVNGIHEVSSKVMSSSRALTG